MLLYWLNPHCLRSNHLFCCYTPHFYWLNPLHIPNPCWLNPSFGWWNPHVYAGSSTGFQPLHWSPGEHFLISILLDIRGYSWVFHVASHLVASNILLLEGKISRATLPLKHPDPWLGPKPESLSSRIHKSAHFGMVPPLTIKFPQLR